MAVADLEQELWWLVVVDVVMVVLFHISNKNFISERTLLCVFVFLGNFSQIIFKSHLKF